MMQREASDCALPSVYALRLRTYSLIGTPQDVPITVREMFTMGSITREASPNPYDNLEEDLPGTIQNPRTGHPPVLAHIIEDELDWQLFGTHPKLNRMPVIFGWLAPHGLVSQYPIAVLRIVNYLLGDTVTEEESHVDWTRARKFHPDV